MNDSEARGFVKVALGRRGPSLGVTITKHGRAKAEGAWARPGIVGDTTTPPNKELKLTKPGQLRSFAA